MKKLIIFIGLLSLAFNSYGHDSERIDQLEQRVLKLESLLSNPSKVEEVVTSGEGWKSVTNWRKLKTGMSYDDVRKILGEPHQIDGGFFARWYYENGGTLEFMADGLASWQEPR